MFTRWVIKLFSAESTVFIQGCLLFVVILGCLSVGMVNYLSAREHASLQTLKTLQVEAAHYASIDEQFDSDTTLDWETLAADHAIRLYPQATESVIATGDVNVLIQYLQQGLQASVGMRAFSLSARPTQLWMQL